VEPWKEAWTHNVEAADLYKKRAVGELSEMESSKAVARLLSDHIALGASILDVGCAAGHYLRSLKSAIKVPFTYTGVDVTPLFIEVAKQAWVNEPMATFQIGDIQHLEFPDNHFDVVMCNNVLLHLPSIVKPIAELLRVSRRLVLIRTLIGDRSFHIKEVRSTLTDAYSKVSAESEFDDNGEPASFNYLNIYSRTFFVSAVRRANPNVRLKFVEDTFFNPAGIEEACRTRTFPNATRMVGGNQVIGYIILPYQFVFIEK
jgi:ubiquinone/menaquinone biosynthesis C-methylase UbiE